MSRVLQNDHEILVHTIIDIVRPANVTPADGSQERIAHYGVDVIDVDGSVLAAQGESVPERNGIGIGRE